MPASAGGEQAMNIIMWAGVTEVCGAMNIINDWGGVKDRQFSTAEEKARPHQKRVGGA